MNNEDTVREYSPQSRILYGLPCARCRAYYPAALLTCPVCKCSERIPPCPTSASIK